IWPTAPFNPPIKPLILSPDSGISKTKRSSNVISPNGLLSSLWVWQHKDESNPFLFATQNSSLHVLFEQRLFLVSSDQLCGKKSISLFSSYSRGHQCAVRSEPGSRALIGRFSSIGYIAPS